MDVFGWAREEFHYAVDVVTSTFGIPVTMERTLDEICADDYDALAIPGGFEGFGFYEEAYDARFLNLIAELTGRESILPASAWVHCPSERAVCSPAAGPRPTT